MAIPTQSAPGGDDALLSPVENDKNVLFLDVTGTKTQALKLTADGSVPVEGTIVVTPPALQNVNITEVGGNAVTTSLPVTVGNFPATTTVVQPTGSNLHADIDNFPATTTVVQPTGASLHVDVDNFPAAVTTVTANQGTPGSLANAWPVELSDGTNLLGTPSHPVRVDPTGTTTQPISGNVGVSSLPSIPAGTNVIGHVITDTGSTTAVTGNVTVVQPTGTNLHVVVDSSPSATASTPVLENALSTTVKSVQSNASAKLKMYYVWNPNTSVAYVQIFDVATSGAVNLGTTVPKLSIGIPAQGAANLDSSSGIAFANGIQVASTTTATGNTALAVAVDANFCFI